MPNDRPPGASGEDVEHPVAGIQMPRGSPAPASWRRETGPAGTTAGSPRQPVRCPVLPARDALRQRMAQPAATRHFDESAHRSVSSAATAAATRLVATPMIVIGVYPCHFL